MWNLSKSYQSYEGLLPTPDSSSFQPHQSQGLLPHPVNQTAQRKRPLLQTPFMPSKGRLLDKSLELTKLPNPVGTLKQPLLGHAPRNASLKSLHKSNAYEKHKAKLHHSTKNVMDLPGAKSVISVQPSHSKDTVEDDGSMELNYLASYLLQMKTGSMQSPPTKNTYSSKSFLVGHAQKVHKNTRMEIDKPNKSHQTNCSQSLSNSAANNSFLKEEHGNLPISNKTPVIKSRDSKVQLNHCASGENFVIIKKKSNEDAGLAGAYVNTGNNVAQNKEQPASTNSSAVRNTSLLELPKQLPIKSNENVFGSTPSCNSTRKRDCSTLDDDSGKSEVKSSKQVKVEGLPHILPVFGYFCDVCCDFFLDEDSTIEHCNSSQHHAQINITHKKQGHLVQTPIANNASFDSDTKQDEQKKKIKQDGTNVSSEQGLTNAGSENTSAHLVAEESLTKTNHSNYCWIKQENKSEVALTTSEGCKSNFKSINPQSARGKKLDNWNNFIIPKRK